MKSCYNKKKDHSFLGVVYLAKQSTKERIIQAAWALFEEKGFDNVSVDEIVAAAKSSKGSFYHYFSKKEDLLVEQPLNIDQNYNLWLSELNPDMHAADKLTHIGRLICRNLELKSSLQMLRLVYSSQLLAKGEQYMYLDSMNRWKLFNRIIAEGQAKGELSDRIACSELSQMLDALLRGLTYNWCLLNGTYSLEAMGGKMFQLLLAPLRSGQAAPGSHETF